MSGNQTLVLKSLVLKSLVSGYHTGGMTGSSWRHSGEESKKLNQHSLITSRFQERSQLHSKRRNGEWKWKRVNLLDGQKVTRLQNVRIDWKIWKWLGLKVARVKSFSFKLKTSLRNRTIGMESEGLSTSYRRSTSHLDLLELELIRTHSIELIWMSATPHSTSTTSASSSRQFS